MVIYLPVLLAIIGLCVYVLTNHPKWTEVGRMTFWVSLLAFLLTDLQHVRL